MIAIKRQVAVVLCGALLMALPVARAEEEATDWKAKCRELEEKVQWLEEELDGRKDEAAHLLSRITELPKFCPRFNVKNLVEINFRQAFLHDVVSELNRHLQSTGTNDIDNAIGLRQKRIQELETEIEQLREVSMNKPIREVRLELPDGMAGERVTFSAVDIKLADALEWITDLSGVAYQVDGDIVRIMPRASERPIPRDELNVKSVKQSLGDVGFSDAVRFSESGLKRAIKEGLIQVRYRDSGWGTGEKIAQHFVSALGVQRFSYLLPSGVDIQNYEIIVAPPGGPFGFGEPLNRLTGTPVASDIRLLRASTETNATVSLVYRDYETNEPVLIDFDKVDGMLFDDSGNCFSRENSHSNHGGFVLVFDPKRKPGIYVYYHVGIKQLRPEDQAYFEPPQYRLDQLFEHELGYFVRVPAYLIPPAPWTVAP